MKTKEIYVKPEIDLVQFESEGVIASSLRVNETENEIDGMARGKQRFWDADY